MALPTLLYGSENYTLTKGQASRIQAAEVRFLRHVAEYTPVSYTHLDVYKRQVLMHIEILLINNLVRVT